MPFDAKAVPDALIDAARRGDLVPLVGSGMSKQASAEFPNWKELLSDMQDSAVSQRFITKGEAQEVKRLVGRGQYLMAAEHLRSVYPTDGYRTMLERRFNPEGILPSDVHTELLGLKPSLILTTNYDRLIEDAYASQYHRSPTMFTYDSAPTLQRAMQAGRLSPGKEPIIFKLHGTIDVPDSIILTEHDYRELLYRQPGYRMVLSAIFLTRTVLMIGFSLDDPELRLLLESHRESLKYQTSPDYAFLPMKSKNSVVIRRLREDFGVQAIPYRPSPGHPEVKEFINYLADQVRTSTA